MAGARTTLVIIVLILWIASNVTSTFVKNKDPAETGPSLKDWASAGLGVAVAVLMTTAFFEIKFRWDLEDIEGVNWSLWILGAALILFVGKDALDQWRKSDTDNNCGVWRKLIDSTSNLIEPTAAV